MTPPFRFAIIGCGKIAPRHAKEASRHGQLVAVCDVVFEKASALAAAYGATAYESPEALFAAVTDIDYIAICTPNGLHATHTIQALRAGFHVLCEKPLCLTTKDANAMIREAESVSKNLFVVKSTRYNPALVSLKALIDQKSLGAVYSFQLNCFWNRPDSYYADSWKGTPDLDGGTLYTQFSHYIDALIWLLGDIKSIAGFRKNMAHQETIAFEDSGVVALEMENGILGGLNWSVNTFQKNMEVSLTIISENGNIRIGGEYMNQVDYQLVKDADFITPSPGEANDYGHYRGSMSNHDQVYDNLIIASRDSSHPFANAIDGLNTVSAIERIYAAVPLSKKNP